MMWDGYGGWGWGGWGFGLLHMLGFWILLIVAVMLIVRWLGGMSGRPDIGHAPHETALEVLKKRYARGEINKEEFESKKRDLSD
jgi:putative membrane protein